MIKTELYKKQKTRPGTLFLWVAWRVLLIQIYGDSGVLLHVELEILRQSSCRDGMTNLRNTIVVSGQRCKGALNFSWSSVSYMSQMNIKGFKKNGLKNENDRSCQKNARKTFCTCLFIGYFSQAGRLF
jgi:hypothetical protein